MDSSFGVGLEPPTSSTIRGRGRARGRWNSRGFLAIPGVEYFSPFPISLGGGRGQGIGSSASIGCESLLREQRDPMLQEITRPSQELNTFLSSDAQFQPAEQVDKEMEFEIICKNPQPELIGHRLDRFIARSKTLIKVRAHDDSSTVEVDANAFCAVSKVFKEMYDISGKETESSEVIMLQVNHSILRHIIKWCEQRYYDEYIPSPLDLKMEQRSMKYVSKTDALFIKQFTTNEVVKMAQAAEYLEIEDLYLLCAKVFYQVLQGKATTEKREEMNLSNDFTNLEENNVRKQNEWYVDLKTMKY